MQVASCRGQAVDSFTVQICASDGSGCLHSNLQSSAVEILENNSTVVAVIFTEMTELLPLNRHYITSISSENIIGITNLTGVHTSESLLIAYMQSIAAYNLSQCSPNCYVIIVVMQSIGTFDIQDVDVLENTQGGLTVICYFAKGSEAKGCCLTIQDLENYTIALRESASNTSAITWLPNFVDDTAEYKVFAYDFESNGICAFGVPAVEKSIIRKLSGKCK